MVTFDTRFDVCYYYLPRNYRQGPKHLPIIFSPFPASIMYKIVIALTGKRWNTGNAIITLLRQEVSKRPLSFTLYYICYSKSRLRFRSKYVYIVAHNHVTNIDFNPVNSFNHGWL